MLESTHERGNRLFVLRSLHVFAGQRCYWSVFKSSDTNVVFLTGIFLILFASNNKRSSGIDGKASNCLSRNCLYYRYLWVTFLL